MKPQGRDLILGADRLVADVIRSLLDTGADPDAPAVAVLVDPTKKEWDEVADFDGGIVAVLTDPTARELLDAVQQGANAVVDADWVAGSLPEVVAHVRRGDAYLTPPQIRIVLDAVRKSGLGDDRPQLSKREGEILESILEGRSVKQTAIHLGITPKTVENLQGRMFRKLDARNRAHAVARAYELGLLDQSEAPTGEDTPHPAGGDRP